MSNILEKIINTVTANGMREITVERAKQIAVEYAEACCKASLEKASYKVTSNWICDNCNEDFTLLENPTSLQTCPHCKKSNHIWIKVNKDSIDIQYNIVIL